MDGSRRLGGREYGGVSGGGRFPFSPDGFACSDQVYQVRVLRCSSIGGKGVVVVVVCSGLRSRFLVSASVHSSPLIMWLHNALYVVWLLSGNVMTDQATLDRAAFRRSAFHSRPRVKHTNLESESNRTPQHTTRTTNEGEHSVPPAGRGHAIDSPPPAKAKAPHETPIDSLPPAFLPCSSPRARSRR